ncbi:GntR family transcriptional regulator [Nocardia sp. 2]|uniref:GntR family transcriptional regulator n=2 Tax=Nocardia acididurans TaxID=2802282 RepID=A0ABS1MGT5_9NOCA|nr:GntR family transcriptional regulator [Nocardia acididurans]
MSDPNTADARYRQIAHQLENDIEAGRLRPGQRIASTRELAAQFEVSVGAINDAMELLISKGLVVSRSRSGRYVALDAAPIDRIRERPKPRAVLVGGYAGSGKTEFGRIFARETGWAMLDKDTLTRSVVDAALVELGSSMQDRDSDIYRNSIRPAEYECLQAAMLENIACGVSVVCTAPYLREFKQRSWFERTSARLEALGADMSVIWIECDIDSMHTYVKRRGAIRDTWKLGHWADYLARDVDVTFRPPWPHTVISNNQDSEPLQAQAKSFLRTLSE